MRKHTILWAVVWTFGLLFGAAQDETLAIQQPSLNPSQISEAFVPDELVVGIEQPELALPQLALDMVGQVTDHLPAINAFVVRLAPGISMESAGEFLRALPGVRYVEPNYKVFACADPNDHYYRQQYAIRRIQANLAWDIWRPRRTVYIAVLDTGIDFTHPDLRNKLRRHRNGAPYAQDFVNNPPIIMDFHGHGTHVSGIAAAQINNRIGVAGVAGWNPSISNSNSFVLIMPVKVLDSTNSGISSDVAAGIIWAADNGAHIINLSLGSPDASRVLQDAVNYAWRRGCLLVAAAGNQGRDLPWYPAYYTNCLAVGSTDSTDTLAPDSQFGSWVDIVAPGVEILSTMIGGYSEGPGAYSVLSGTSMACPHVAGAAALLWAHNPSLSNSQLRQALENNVDPYRPFRGRTIGAGKGRLNVFRALRSVDRR